MIRVIFLFLCIFCVVSPLGAQKKPMPEPFLEREITLKVENQTIETILQEISRQAGFGFSYNPDIIKTSTKISIDVYRKPVRLVLKLLFADEVIYKVRGNHVILKKNSQPTNSSVEKQFIEGYVYDSRTGQRITNASVYDKTLLASAVSNQYGYFSMELPVARPITSLQISKDGYADTLVLSLSPEQLQRAFEIRLNRSDTSVTGWHPFAKLQDFTPSWLIPEKIRFNAININDSIFRAVQFSLIPALSTNHFLGGNIANDVSINLLVGYVQGIRIAEIGGLLNIDRGDVRYFQAGGIGNVVGGNFTGFQAGGLFNVAQQVKGVQVAGIFNRSTQNFLQIGGIFNKSESAKVQLGGIVNFTENTVVQVAGLINIADTAKAVQIAGIVNRANHPGYFQLAGLANQTEGEVGIQISGLWNRARKVSAVQLSLVNIADTNSGVAIGLLNFIKKGYGSFEISADETFPVNFAYRSGVPKFHSIVMAGFFPVYPKVLPWTLGLGIGTSAIKSNKLLLDLDIMYQQVLTKNDVSFSNHVFRIYAGFDRKIFSKTSIAFGLSYNFLLADGLKSSYEDIDGRVPFYSVSTASFANGHILKSWVGAKVAIRFSK